MTIKKSRREFLRDVTTIGTGLYTSSLFLFNSRMFNSVYAETDVPSKSKVILARDKEFINFNGKANISLINKAIDKALEKITDTKKPSDAWERLFYKDDIVGIKVNCLAGSQFSPHIEIIESIVNGLRSAGVKEGNIIIFERFSKELDNAGYKTRKNKVGIKCFGTDELPQSGYDQQPQIIGSVGSCFSQIISSYCTAIINVPVLKDHDLAGTSIGMKNFFGVIHNPNKYHDGNCNPYIADLNSHPYIKGKLRLIICDALKAQYNGGPAFKPQWAWDYRGILVGIDPVALDRIGTQIIEEKRKEVNMPSLKEAGREPKYINTAAQLGLGIDDPALIDVVSI
ncbi:MAG: DUF362 domain-containing protein [Candidatus Scalinduaceae bacterium]